MDLAKMLMFQQLNQLPADGAAQMLSPMAAPPENPVAKMMRGPASDDTDMLQLKKLSMTGAFGRNSPPAAEKAYNAYLASSSKGLKEQRDGVTRLEDMLNAQKASGSGTWEKVFAGALDTVSGSKNLKELMTGDRANDTLNLQNARDLQKSKNDITKNETDLTEAQLKYEQQKIKDAQTARQWSMAFGLKQDKAGTKKSVGQDQADKDFAKEYVDWNQKGGRENYTKDRNSLEEALNELMADDSLTGGWVGATPDSMLPYVHPKAAAMQQKVEATVIALVKQLGNNPTDNDLKQILKSIWDRRLPPKDNIAKVRAALVALDGRSKSKDESSQYFESTGGTLEGQGLATRRAAAPGGGGVDPAKARYEELKARAAKAGK